MDIIETTYFGFDFSDASKIKQNVYFFIQKGGESVKWHIPDTYAELYTHNFTLLATLVREEGEGIDVNKISSLNNMVKFCIFKFNLTFITSTNLQMKMLWSQSLNCNLT